MPLYEYRCRNCNHQFEVQQSFSDDALAECPQCAGELRKVFNPVGISFKGSGFYKNDSRSAGSSSSTSSGASSGASTSDGSSTSSSSADSTASSSSGDSTSKATASSTAGSPKDT